ncbi:MAG: T9SS type A sorting domain-containing protein [Chloroflexota bacterium]
MLRKISVLVMAMALLLAACAQAASETPYRVTVAPTDASDEAPETATSTPDAYPNPPQAAVPAEINPAYPAPGEDPAQAEEVENLALEKGLNSEFAPQESDLELTAGPAYVEIDASEVSLARDTKATVALHLVGTLPNPCYQLRVLVREPGKEGRLNVVVYSVANPEKVCIQVLQPFEETVLLDSLPAGTYTVYVNDTELGQVEVK